MRRTVFVFQTDLAPTALESTARPLALRDRATIMPLLHAQLGWTEDHLTEIEDSIVAVVTANGTITGRELAEALPVLRTKIRPSSSSSSNAPGQPVSMRILYNQAHGPGRSLRRPVYIHPFLRGPDDAPIKLSTTVRMLGSRPAQAPRS